MPVVIEQYVEIIEKKTPSGFIISSRVLLRQVYVGNEHVRSPTVEVVGVPYFLFFFYLAKKS